MTARRLWLLHYTGSAFWNGTHVTWQLKLAATCCSVWTLCALHLINNGAGTTNSRITYLSGQHKSGDAKLPGALSESDFFVFKCICSRLSWCFFFSSSFRRQTCLCSAGGCERLPDLPGLEDGQMVALQNRVTPNLHSLALSLLPPTGHSINLIASSCCATWARDKWVFRLHVCVFVCNPPSGVVQPSLHHMVQVGIKAARLDSNKGNLTGAVSWCD